VNKDLKIEYLGGRLYRLYMADADKFDVVRYLSDLYRSAPEEFENVKVEVVYDAFRPLSAKDRNFIKWRIKSFTAGNIVVVFKEEGMDSESEREKVIPLKPEKIVKQEKLVVETSNAKDEKVLAGNGEEEHFDTTSIVLGTMRSGDELDVDGGIVIVGDVHPGADIYASGAVIVLGSLGGRIILLSEKSYVIVKECEKGVIIWNGMVYECEEKSSDNWTLVLPNGKKVNLYTDKIGVLARRVKEWLEE